jgi:hypothetical protein
VSKLEVDVLKSVTGSSIAFERKLIVKDSTETFEAFVSSTAGNFITGLIYTGTEYDNTPGISGQILFGSDGPTSSVSWKFPPVPSLVGIEKGTIVPWIVNYNPFCPSGSLPPVPTTDNIPDWEYCTGRNGTPDYRITNPFSPTGGKEFPPFSSSDIVVTLQVTGPTTDIRRLYQTNNLERLVFYGTSICGDSGPTTQWALGPTTSSTIGVLLSITGPTVVGNSQRPTGVPTHEYAVIVIGGATGETASLWENAQRVPQLIVSGYVGEFYKGSPTDFTVNGYINFKTGTGTIFRIHNISSTEYIQPATVQPWLNRCRYKNSISYLRRL